MKKPKTKLTRKEEDAAKLFSKLSTGEDVANFLEISYGQLLYLLYKIDDKNKYISFSIPKKNNGRRLILKPCKGINILQNKLYPYLEQKYHVKAPVHGFVSDRSIVSNAINHVKRRYIKY